MRSNDPSCPAVACSLSDAIGVANLPVPERVMLWAIRAWSAHHCDLTAIRLSLDSTFAAEGMRAAVPSFDRMMAALFSGLRRWPDVRCVRCPRLGSDEASLLTAFGHLQRGEEGAARRSLHDWVLRPAARTACVSGAEFIGLASAAGWQFQTATLRSMSLVTSLPPSITATVPGSSPLA